MKKLNILNCAFALLLSSLMSACEKNEPEQKVPISLETPSGITCEAGEMQMAFAWEGGGSGIASYDIEFKEASDAAAIVTATVTTNAWSKDGLQAETYYRIRIKACAEKNSTEYANSEWSQWSEFSTIEGEVAVKFDSGTGKESDPYIIKTPGQLARLAKMVNDEVEGFYEYGVYYKLGSDIDLSSAAKWTPIGVGTGSIFYNVGEQTASKVFRGNFDGDGHTVSGLSVDITDDGQEIYGGLFGMNIGYIKNVKVEGSVSLKSIYSGDEQGVAAAGGIAGMSTIAYDGDITKPLTGTGGIVGCTFKGSVTADSNMDDDGVAPAGGICGMALSGNIDDCSAEIPSGMSIESISGNAPAAAGIVGAQMAGRTTNGTVKIDGEINAKHSALSPLNGDLACAGGILGYCGRLADAHGQPGVANCNVTINGAIKAYTDKEGCNAATGGVVGNSTSDLTADCNVNVIGSIIAEAPNSTMAGGIVGLVASSGGAGANNFVACTANIDGEIAALSGGTASGMLQTSVGGIAGNSEKGSLVLCNTKINGKLTASSASATSIVNCGGVAGSAGNVNGSSAVITATGKIETRGGTQHVGGVVGFFRMAANIRLIANYSIIDGTIETLPVTDGASYKSFTGGVAGHMQGVTVGTKRAAQIYACYSLLRGSFLSQSSANPAQKGALVGNTNSMSAINNYWWSTDTQTTYPLGNNTTPSGMYGFASIDEAGFTAAATEMNQTITDNGATAAFEYNAQEGYLILKTSGN